MSAGDRARRHTRYFLEWARAASPVYLAADVDVTRIRRHREQAGRRYSYVSYLLYAAGRVLPAHPRAGAVAQGGRLRPRTAALPGTAAKLALDRTTAGGERVVLTAVLPDIDRLELDDVQDFVDRCRTAAPDELPGARGLRRLDALPPLLGRLAFRLGVRRPADRLRLLGSFAVSSLGHRAVDDFHGYGGTAVTFCVTRVADRPLVRDGRITVAPVMRLGLTFDHRVLDGAAAADVLDSVVTRLEDWHELSPGTPGSADGGGGAAPARAGDRTRGAVAPGA
ncbi:hypothetical protein SRB5_17790 [Streptomyces sp. RB5]|uniref:2-oxoacid dehydrogenase acyltransferase catalytic domain-containing protein n=1 Tax=Streptomyces smaragdinus TaxID=2585196 RepID=A0A7K0CDY1_9ACTN|nr:2-oxo acid dehydrogenase subunit E2 [Streptomyces smaragdinus]MQY11660.1 hypothetical protein [Streptomyces smaragdinus]